MIIAHYCTTLIISLGLDARAFARRARQTYGDLVVRHSHLPRLVPADQPVKDYLLLRPHLEDRLLKLTSLILVK